MIKNNEALSMAESIEYIDKDSGADALGFVRKFTGLKPKDGKEMREKIEAMGSIKIDSKSISKIIDFLPENEEELNKIFVGISLDEEEIKKILDIVKEYR